MKRRFALLALLTIPIAGLFLASRNAASWRPQTITQQQLQARAQTVATPTDWTDDDSLTKVQKQLKRRFSSQGWNLRAPSPDETQWLAQGKTCDDVALLNARDGSVQHQLSLPTQDNCGEWRGAQFSPDGRYVEFSQFESTPPQVFDAHTGRHLWNADYWNAKFAFSPDGTFAAHTNGNEDFVLVRDAATGRELKRLPYKYNEGTLTFARDSHSLLAEVAPGQFRQLRLR